ncbi:hypothetical protein TA3x_002609 [Tundrisphaera sp. TA3]|uniref:hypothetical protein n=1 Tax=Tundrisphaera sp. TA3 TaxID=3435775 RepID=UPI003EBE12C9
MTPTPPTGPLVVAPQPPPGRRRRWAWAVLGLVLAAHAYQSARLFPGIGSILDPEAPVIMVDHAIHLYHGSLGATFFRNHATSWGYDPMFLAGYPETPVWDSSSNPSILFQLLGGGGYRPRAYKLGLLLLSLLIPAAIAGGAWGLGLGAGEVAAAAALGWIYFWGAFPAVLWRTGLFAFISAAAGVGLLLGLCVRFDRRPTRGNWAALAACGVVLFFLHVTAPVMALGGALAFYATVARKHDRRWHAAVLGAAAVTVVANLTWLVSLWRFRGLRTGTGFFMTSDSPLYLLEYYLGPDPDGRLGLLILIPGVLGLIRWRKIGRRAEAAAFGGSILALLLMTGFGSLWGPTRVMEPLRFRVPLQFLLAVPAGSCLIAATGWLIRKAGGGARGGLTAAIAWGLAVTGWLYADARVARSMVAGLIQHRPLVVGVPPEARALVDWIKANTDASARIMLEDQLRLLEATDPESVHWTPLLPTLLGPDARMFIGGLYQTAFIRHHKMAAFGDFQLGDRPIDKWNATQLRAYCDLYNVGWVICWSPLSRFWFDRFPGATKVATLPRVATPGWPASPNDHEWAAMTRRAGSIVARRYMMEGEGSYSVYRVERPHSFFLKGKGRLVSFGPNRVELADVEPQDGVAVVSLHWLDTWKAEPPATIGPEPAPPGDVPFLRIESKVPIPRLVIENRY